MESQSRCFQTLEPVTSSHRCPACTLNAAARNYAAERDLLRQDVRRLRDELAKAQSALLAEQDAHALTHRRYQRLMKEAA